MYNHLGEGGPKNAKDGGKKKSPDCPGRKRSMIEGDQCMEEGRDNVCMYDNQRNEDDELWKN